MDHEVRRDSDGERCGFVAERDGRWLAMVVFGGVIGVHDHRADAEQQVLDDGLASLAERWTLRNVATGDEQVVCIQEASSSEVRLALDYVSMPGVPTLTITADQLAAGEWLLVR